MKTKTCYICKEDFPRNDLAKIKYDPGKSVFACRTHAGVAELEAKQQEKKKDPAPSAL